MHRDLECSIGLTTDPSLVWLPLLCHLPHPQAQMEGIQRAVHLPKEASQRRLRVRLLVAYSIAIFLYQIHPSSLLDELASGSLVSLTARACMCGLVLAKEPEESI